MLSFIIGCMTGGFFGVAAMCVFAVSGRCSREEERREESV